jgi:hypothetical protein
VHPACRIRWRTAVPSGRGRARAATTARSMNTVFWLVTGQMACSELVVRGRVELPTFRFSGEILPSRAVAGRRLASLGVCLRWLPLWLPVWLPFDSLNRQAESHQRRVIGGMGSHSGYITVAQRTVPSGGFYRYLTRSGSGSQRTARASAATIIRGSKVHAYVGCPQIEEYSSNSG